MTSLVRRPRVRGGAARGGGGGIIRVGGIIPVGDDGAPVGVPDERIAEDVLSGVVATIFPSAVVDNQSNAGVDSGKGFHILAGADRASIPGTPLTFAAGSQDLANADLDQAGVVDLTSAWAVLQPAGSGHTGALGIELGNPFIVFAVPSDAQVTAGRTAHLFYVLSSQRLYLGWNHFTVRLEDLPDIYSPTGHPVSIFSDVAWIGNGAGPVYTNAEAYDPASGVHENRDDAVAFMQARRGYYNRVFDLAGGRGRDVAYLDSFSGLLKYVTITDPGLIGVSGEAAPDGEGEIGPDGIYRIPAFEYLDLPDLGVDPLAGNSWSISGVKRYVGLNALDLNPASLSASTAFTDADVRGGVHTGTTALWSGIFNGSQISPDATSVTQVFYRDQPGDRRLLRLAINGGVFVGITSRSIWDTTTWAHTVDLDGSITNGSGRFASDAAVLAYVSENEAHFRGLGRTKIAYFNTTTTNVRVATWTPPAAANLSASAELTNATVRGGTDTGTTAVWRGLVLIAPPAAPELQVFYRTASGEERMFIRAGSSVYAASSARIWSDTMWANTASISSAPPAGSGRFADDAAVFAYLNANLDTFHARYIVGRTHIAYFNTTSDTVRRTLWTPVVDVEVNGPQEAFSEDLGGFGGAYEWRSPPVVDEYWQNPQPANILVVVAYRTGVSDAGQSGTGRLQFSHSNALYNVVRDSQVFASDITWADAADEASHGHGHRYSSGTGKFANQTALLIYVEENEAEFAERYVAGKRRLAFFNTNVQSVQIASFRVSHGDDPDEPASIEIDGDSENIVLSYAPASEEQAVADTIGDLEPVLERLTLLGVEASRFGSPGSDDVFSRPVGWKIDFSGGGSTTIELTGDARGPNGEFTGDSLSAVEAARDAYADARPGWTQAYGDNPELYIELTYGSTVLRQWYDSGTSAWQEASGGSGGGGGIEELVPETTVADPTDWDVSSSGTILPTIDLGRGLTLDDDGDKSLFIEFDPDSTTDHFYLWSTTVRQFLKTDPAATDLDGWAHVGMTKRWTDDDSLTGASVRHVFIARRTITGSSNTGLAMVLNDNTAISPAGIKYRITLRGGGSSGDGGPVQSQQQSSSRDTAAEILAKLITVDGDGSGLDADTVDGLTPEEIAALGGGSSDSAAQVLAKLLTVDGPGSSLDADTVDGMQAAEFAASSAIPTDDEISTIADARALARFTAAEKTKLAAAAPLDDPAFTGTPTVPALTGTEGATQAAPKGYVDAQVAAVDTSGGGGSSSAAVAPETLYDGLSGAGFSLRANSSDWSVNERIPFTKAFAEPDDGSDLRIFGSYMNGGVVKYLDFEVEAEHFRIMEAIDGSESDSGKTISFHVQRPVATGSTPGLSGWSEGLIHVGRWRDSSGNDGAWFNLGSQVDLTNFTDVKLKAILVPAGATIPVPILGPGDDPTESDWEQQGFKWSGERMLRIRRDVIGDHGIIVHFATIDPADGMEIIRTVSHMGGNTAANFADMREARDGDDETIAVQWVMAFNMLAGDIVYVAGDPSTFYIALSNHASVAANQPGTAGGNALWLIYTRASVVDAASFRGVFPSIAIAEAGGTADTNGDWFITLGGGLAGALERLRDPDGWITKDTAPATLHATIFGTNSAAHSEVRQFSSSEPQYFVIGGFLKVLQFYEAPAAGTASYRAVPSDELYANILLQKALGVPTHARVGQAQWYRGQLYECEEIKGIAPVVGWDYPASGTDVGALWGVADDDFVYRGANARSDPAQDGDVVAYTGGHFEIYLTTVNPQGWRHLWLPDGWQGSFPDEDTADHKVTAVGDTAIVAGALGSVTSFVAGALPHYDWIPRLPVEGASSLQQEGVTYSGPDFGSYRLYQKSASQPSSVGVGFGAAGNLLPGTWFTVRASAISAYTGSAADTVWICTGSGSRSSSTGIWSNNGSTVFAEWDAGYSSVGPSGAESDWHADLVETDTWARSRNADGVFEYFPLRNREPRDPIYLSPAGQQLRLTSSTQVNQITLTNEISEIDDYDFLGFEIESGSDGAHTNHGPPHIGLISRPAGGWHVNSVSNRLYTVYRMDAGTFVTREDSTIGSIPNSGSFSAGTDVISHYMKLTDQDRGIDVRGGAVKKFNAEYLGGTYGYGQGRLVGVIL